MIRTVLASLAASALLFAESACQEPPQPTKAPTAKETTQGPPPRPEKGVEGIPGCPVNTGTVEEVYYGTVTKSQAENRVGTERIFVLRWVNKRDMPGGGCWQQTGFAITAANDRQLSKCQKGDAWTACTHE